MCVGGFARIEAGGRLVDVGPVAGRIAKIDQAADQGIQPRGLRRVWLLNREALMEVALPGDFRFEEDRLFSGDDEAEQGRFARFGLKVVDRDLSQAGGGRDHEPLGGNDPEARDFDVRGVGHQGGQLFPHFRAGIAGRGEGAGRRFVEEFGQRAPGGRRLWVHGLPRRKIDAKRFDRVALERRFDFRRHASRRKRRRGQRGNGFVLNDVLGEADRRVPGSLSVQSTGRLRRAFDFGFAQHGFIGQAASSLPPVGRRRRFVLRFDDVAGVGLCHGHHE